MQFEFAAEQQELGAQLRRLLAEHCPPRAVRRILEGGDSFDRALWARMAGLGLMGAAIPEEYGGAGGGFLELCVIAEELGRSLAPVPFASSVYLGAELIKAAGTDRQKRTHLPPLAAGSRIACLGLSEGPGQPGPAAITATVSGGVLTGTKWPVLDGGVAGLAIVAAREDGAVSLFLVDLDGPGVVRTALATIDPTRNQARLDFANAPAERLGAAGAGWPLLETALDRAAVLVAFEQVGGAEQAIAAARDHALERTAFGRPIGSFQAIKHKLADMWIAAVLARSNAYFGAWAASAGTDALPRAAAASRVSATEAFQLCSKENIQIHGGMGFTWDADCHLFFRRFQMLAVALGGLSFWQDRLVAHLRPGQGVAALAA